MGHNGLKNRVWFKTDLGYETTIEKLSQSGMFTGLGYLGRYSFCFKASKDITFQITSRGKLGIFYPKEISVKDCREQIMPFLVRADGSPARIVKELYSSESTPSDSENGKTERRAKRKSREKEREVLELDVEGYALMEEIRLKEDEYDDEMTPEKRVRRRKKYRELLEQNS